MASADFVRQAFETRQCRDFVRLAFVTRYCRDFGTGAAARGLAASSGSAGGAFRHRQSPGGANGKSTTPGALNVITTGFIANGDREPGGREPATARRLTPSGSNAGAPGTGFGKAGSSAGTTGRGSGNGAAARGLTASGGSAGGTSKGSGIGAAAPGLPASGGSAGNTERRNREGRPLAFGDTPLHQTRRGSTRRSPGTGGRCVSEEEAGCAALSSAWAVAGGPRTPALDLPSPSPGAQ